MARRITPDQLMKQLHQRNSSSNLTSLLESNSPLSNDNNNSNTNDKNPNHTNQNDSTYTESKRISAITLIQALYRAKQARKNYKNDRGRYALVKELISFEKSYVKNLGLVVSIYMRPLRTFASSQDPILTMTDINKIFSSLEEIYR